MSFKKSPIAYVCDHKIFSKPRTVTPFVLNDRYDHLEVLKYSHDVIWMRRKFSKND